MYMYMHFRLLTSRSSSHGFYSDAHWRCSTEVSDLWFASAYDDSSWSNAHVIMGHTTFTVDYLAAEFGENAKPIWYFDESYEGTIYCRARLAYGGLRIVTPTFQVICVKVCMFL